MKQCFTFIHNRYLLHPKQEHELRQPWCRLTMFDEFRDSALSLSKVMRPAAAKSGPKAKQAVAKRLPGSLQPKKVFVGPDPFPSKPETPATPVAKAGKGTLDSKAVPAKAVPPVQRAPMTPMPGQMM